MVIIGEVDAYLFVNPRILQKHDGRRHMLLLQHWAPLRPRTSLLHGSCNTLTYLFNHIGWQLTQKTERSLNHSVFKRSAELEEFDPKK